MLHTTLVLLPDALHHQSHQHRTLRAKFLQVDVHRVVRTVHCLTVVDEVRHLYVQDTGLTGILHVKAVIGPVLSYDAHVRLALEPLKPLR